MKYESNNSVLRYKTTRRYRSKLTNQKICQNFNKFLVFTLQLVFNWPLKTYQKQYYFNLVFFFLTNVG